jgi:ferredoxin
MPEVFFETSGRRVSFPEGEEVNLLRLSLRHRCGVPWRCASGNCGTDRLLIVEGHEHLSPMRRRERERLGELVDQGYRLSCQTYTSGDLTVRWDPNQKGLDEESVAGQRLKARWLGVGDDGKQSSVVEDDCLLENAGQDVPVADKV